MCPILKRSTLALWLALALMGGAGRLVAAQEPPPADSNAPAEETSAPPATEPTTRPAEPADARSSARATLRELLRAVSDAADRPERIRDAVACLDTSGLAPADQEKAPHLAEQLAAAIDRVFRERKLRSEDVPDAPDGDPYVLYELDDQRMELARGDDGRWRFTAETLAALPTLQDAWRAADRERESTERNEPATRKVLPERRTPRATMLTFLGAASKGQLVEAAACMDVSRIDVATRWDVAQRLARRLREIIDRLGPVVAQDIPDDPEGDTYTFYISEHGRIEIARVDNGDREGEWLFTASTVASIEPLLAALEEQSPASAPSMTSFWEDPSLWIRARLPASMKRDVLGMKLWQWPGLGIVVLVGVLVRFIARAILPFVLGRFVRREEPHSSRALRSLCGAFSAALMLATWWLGVWVIDLSVNILPAVLLPLRVAMIAAGIWAAYEFTDLFFRTALARLSRASPGLPEVLFPLLRKTAKVVLVALGATWILHAVGFNVGPLLAGLGLGGLAFGLAAQDTLKTFFGSVNIVLDRPFQVGDWVRIGNHEGRVESVGLRSTRLRTADNSELSLPNDDIMRSAIDNVGRRRFRRVRTTLPVAQGTPPERLEALCEGIRELIRRHPYTVHADYQVYVSQFTPTAAEIMLYCYLETPNWDTELRERHRLLTDAMRLAARLDVPFAVPGRAPAAAADAGDGGLPQTPVRVPVDPAGAQALGRELAASILRESLGDPPQIPPPVQF